MAVGDYSEEYGHIKTIVKERDNYVVTFKDGREKTLAPDAELDLIQGGRF